MGDLLSGFPVPDRTTSKDEYRPSYLVTAGHVIVDMKADMASNDSRVRIRVNTTKSGQEWIDTSVRFWEPHPDFPKVDLALLKIGLESQLWDHICWPMELLVKDESVDGNQSDRKIELGDELFFPGLFWPHKGVTKNIPIVRIGNVAALRDEPVTNREGHQMDAYLGESRSIGGLSGSPVFVDLFGLKMAKPPSGGLMAAAHHHASPNRFRLFGVVHGHFDWEDKEPDSSVSTSMDSSQNKLGVNMGIAIIIPAEKIIEVFEVFKTEEEHEIAEVRKRKEICLTGDTAIPVANVTYQVTGTGFHVASPGSKLSHDPNEALREKK